MKRIALCVLTLAIVRAAPADPPLLLNDDGAWSWFEDERAVLQDGRLLVGSVAAGSRDPARRGDIELTVLEIATAATTRVELHDRLERDDHDSPALLVLPDGRALAVYARHGPENRFYYRRSHPGDPTRWAPERTFVPSDSSRITYSNLHRLAAENGGRGRIYNFFRGLDASFKPSFAWSDDDGRSWHTGSIVIHVPARFRHRPYVKYASNGTDTVHLTYTEGHPRDFDNSIYHVFYRDGTLHRSDGTPVAPLADGLERPAAGTPVFHGDPDNVAWIHDLHLDSQGRPYAAFSVQKDSAGLPRGRGGDDHRYHFARWDGQRWHSREIAFAGPRLYPGEDDYTGGIALDPDDPGTVYISTSVDPADGQPLASGHHELFRGTSQDGGATWRWTALTPGATRDHLRPIVPRSDGRHHAVVWLRGEYRSYTDYDLEVVGWVTP